MVEFFEGADAFISSMVGFALAAPGYTLRDVNDWFDGQKVSAERLVPQTSALDARTHRRIQDLRIEVANGDVILHGRAVSYHLKQLAQHGILDVMPDVHLVNAIEVWN
jgi:hypothetical protein